MLITDKCTYTPLLPRKKHATNDHKVPRPLATLIEFTMSSVDRLNAE